jgi:hypothetical protein
VGPIVCTDEDAGAPPCDRVRPHRRPNRLNPNEIADLERLFASLPEGHPEALLVLRRLAVVELELTCVAKRDCEQHLTSDPRTASKEARIGRDAVAKFRTRCAQLRERRDPHLPHACEP